MPSFENIEIPASVTIDFEVFCKTCGEGLCNESSTRVSRNRGFLQVEVNACPSCIEEKDKTIAELQAEIDELKNEMENIHLTLQKIVDINESTRI